MEEAKRALRIYEILSSEDVIIDEDEFIINALDNIKRNKSETGFSRQLQAILADRDRFNELGNITVPTLIIHGTLDPLIPINAGKLTSKLIPNNTY